MSSIRKTNRTQSGVRTDGIFRTGATGCHVPGYGAPAYGAFGSILPCLAMLRRLLGLLLVSWAALLVTGEPAQGQQRVHILQADSLFGQVTEQGQVRSLIGNVLLQTDDFTVHADSAFHYQDQEELMAYGNIEIITEQEHIWADRAYYDLAEEHSEFTGRVIMMGPDAVLYSAHISYDFDTEIATLPHPLRLEDRRGSLLADSGIYYNRQDSAIFRGNVQSTDAAQYIEADSIFSNRQAEYYELHGRVYLHDEEENASLTGRYVESDADGNRLVEDEARLQRISIPDPDTTDIQAERIEMWQRGDTADVFEAYHDVRIWNQAYASRSDTAIYEEDRHLFTLKGSPRTWQENLQLTGPYIEIQLDGNQVRSLTSHPWPFVVQHDTVINRFNQITGDTLQAHFEAGRISSMYVHPQAEVLYHSRDDDGEPDGAIEMSADRYLHLFFKDGELEDGKAESQVDGQVLPEAEKLADRRLDGFVWDPEDRPRKPDTPPSPRLPPIPDAPFFLYPDRYLLYRALQPPEPLIDPPEGPPVESNR